MAGVMRVVPPGSFVPGRIGFYETGTTSGMNNCFVPPHQQRQQQQTGGRRGPNNRGQKPQRDGQANSQPQPPSIPSCRPSASSGHLCSLLPHLLNKDQHIFHQSDHDHPLLASSVGILTPRQWLFQRAVSFRASSGEQVKDCRD